MAYKETETVDSIFPEGFYNVNLPVGKGSKNRSGDVMLVQLLLKKYYSMIGKVKGGYIPYGNMVVDGLFGPTTSRWIIQFQIRQKPLFTKGIMVDGVVDRARDPWAGTISGTTYTILALNHQVRLLDPQGFAQLHADPECPILLAGEILFNDGNM